MQNTIRRESSSLDFPWRGQEKYLAKSVYYRDEESVDEVYTLIVKTAANDRGLCKQISEQNDSEATSDAIRAIRGFICSYY